MAVPIVNFGLVTVSGGYSSSDTAIILQTGDGSKLPATTGGYRYPLTWWDAATYAHAADDPNREIVLVTDRAGDVLTVTRGQESTSGSAKNTAGKTYRMSLGVTKALWDSMRIKNTHQGLVLRTDRDADTSQRQVEIIALDYLVMDDGTFMSNSDNSWTGKYADITQSGAAGLDTGSEFGGQWYEIFAIAKEDGTKNLILHQSKAWSDEAAYTINEDASQNVGSASSNQWVAQGFTLSASGTLKYVQAKLLKVGAPTGQLSCAVYSDNAGVPGSVLAFSHNIDIASIPTTATWIHFEFSVGSLQLSASPTQYHVVIATVVNASNYLQWRMDGSAATYANGSKAIWNGGAWTTDTDDDMMFVVGLEKDESAVVMPSGYTKKCHLGYVFNDGDSNFVPFFQQGRSRRDLIITEANNYTIVLNGLAQLHRVYGPPIKGVRALLAVSGTGTQAGIAAIGSSIAYNISSAGDTTSAEAILYSGTTTTRPGVFVEVLVLDEFYYVHGTDTAKIWQCGFSW